MPLKIVYLLMRWSFGLIALVFCGDHAKDAELLGLRHENAVLRRNAGRIRYEPASSGRARAIAERAEGAVRVIAIEHAGDGDRCPVAAVPVGQAHPDELAYLVYTSGSTGNPKGVTVTHGNLAPLMAWSADHFGLGPGTRVVQNLNPAFDFGIWEMLTTVCAGGTLYFPGWVGGLTPSAFVQAIADWRIDTLHTTPAFFAELAFTGRRLDSLRQVHLGGEKLTGGLVAQAAGVLTPGCRIHNGYGPTEATVNCSIHVIDRKRISSSHTVPIGVASAENLLYILSETLEEIPDGERTLTHQRKNSSAPCAASPLSDSRST